MNAIHFVNKSFNILFFCGITEDGYRVRVECSREKDLIEYQKAIFQELDLEFLMDMSKNDQDFIELVNFSEKSAFRDRDYEKLWQIKEKYIINIEDYKGNFEFPSGHPIAGKYYKEHPLKKGFYILAKDYRKVLEKEIEKEMIDVLINLGAMEIKISNESFTEDDIESSKKGSTSFGIFNSKAEKCFKKNENNINNKYKNFSFEGKIWYEGEKLDRSKYKFIEFNEELEEIVSSRENGLCVSAEIKINNKNQIKSESTLDVDLEKLPLFLKFNANINEASLQEECKYLYVTFTKAKKNKKLSIQ